MSDYAEICGKLRESVGRGAARQVRRQGEVPGVVYGENKELIHITVDPGDIFHELQTRGVGSRVMCLSVEGKKEKIVIQDVHFHPVTGKILNVDFRRVTPESKMKLKVALKFENADSAVGLRLGGKINFISRYVTCRGVLKNFPQYIAIDLAGMQIKEGMRVKDLILPHGLEVLDDPMGTLVFMKGQGGGVKALLEGEDA